MSILLKTTLSVAFSPIHRPVRRFVEYSEAAVNQTRSSGDRRELVIKAERQVVIASSSFEFITEITVSLQRGHVVRS